MTRILVDDILRNKLHNFSQPVEICDEAGRVLAQVLPNPAAAGFILEPQVSDEEIQRRLNSNEPGFTTAEVIAHLERL